MKEMLERHGFKGSEYTFCGAGPATYFWHSPRNGFAISDPCLKYLTRPGNIDPVDLPMYLASPYSPKVLDKIFEALCSPETWEGTLGPHVLRDRDSAKNYIEDMASALIPLWTAMLEHPR